jgi:hypothetical protein
MPRQITPSSLIEEYLQIAMNESVGGLSLDLQKEFVGDAGAEHGSAHIFRAGVSRDLAKSSRAGSLSDDTVS